MNEIDIALVIDKNALMKHQSILSHFQPQREKKSPLQFTFPQM